MSEEKNPLWPFRVRRYPECGWVYACGVDDRLGLVRGLTDVARLRAMLAVPGVQKAVARAIERRLKELGHV